MIEAIAATSKTSKKTSRYIFRNAKRRRKRPSGELLPPEGPGVTGPLLCEAGWGDKVAVGWVAGAEDCSTTVPEPSRDSRLFSLFGGTGVWFSIGVIIF